MLRTIGKSWAHSIINEGLTLTAAAFGKMTLRVKCRDLLDRERYGD